eukprot:2165578-Prymnesium_polylepis.1
MVASAAAVRAAAQAEVGEEQLGISTMMRGECGEHELAAEAREIFEAIHGDEEDDGVQWAAHCTSDRHAYA